MQTIIFGGAATAMILVFGTVIISLVMFIWQWISDDFLKGSKNS